MALSQEDIFVDLLDVQKWNSHEKLNETLSTVFDKINFSISAANSTSNVEEALAAVKALCQNVLPCIKLKDLENKVLAKLCPKLKSFFDANLNLINECLKQNLQNNNNGKSSSVYEEVNQLLRIVLGLLECVEDCIMYVHGFDEAVGISDISSLPECVIYLIQGTYKHCKGSSETYKDYNLEMFSESLSVLFKRTHAIQISFLGLMDKLQTPESMTEQNVWVLNSVCMGLFQICQIVTSLDIKLIVSLWKSISKLVVQYMQFLSDVVNVSEMVVYLCQEIKTGYQYLLQQFPDRDLPDMTWSSSDEKTFQKSIKILGFEIKILISLCQEYLEFFDETKTDKEVYSLLIFTHKNTPQWSTKSISSEHCDEINRQLIVTCDPLLTSFLERPQFQCCFLGVQILKEDSFSLLLMLVSVTKSFAKMSEDNQDAWMGVTKLYERKLKNVIELMFNLVDNCYVQINDLNVTLPGIMCSGTAQRYVSFYEFLTTHIAGFIGSLPEKYFSLLESTLFSKLFSGSPTTQMIAVDCWCFMDRYGSSELCLAHVEFFLKILEQHSPYYPLFCEGDSLMRLIPRLFVFLEPQEQAKIMVRNSNPVNMKFWCLGLLNAAAELPADQGTIINSVITVCISQLESWLQTMPNTKESFKDATMNLKVLNNVFSGGMHSHPSNHINLVTDIIEKIFTLLFKNEWDQCLVLDLFLNELLQFLPVTLDYFPKEQSHQVFCLLKELIKNKPSLMQTNAILKFFNYVAKIMLPKPETCALVQDILLLISANQNGLINHMFMESLTNFAEKTLHNDIVPNCLKLDKQLEPKFVSFINKIICKQLDTKRFLIGQHEKLSCGVPLTWQDEVKIDFNASVDISVMSTNADGQPSSKRARIEENLESSFEDIFKNLESDWASFELAARNENVPDWFKNSVKYVLDAWLKKLS